MRERVLVVDDDDDMREVVCLVLEESGYGVRSAASGRDCLAIAAEWQPHVVLLDLGMPGMDGYEAAMGLRALDRSALRIIALTGSDLIDARAAALFDAYALKPFGLDKLLRTLEDVIAGTTP